MADKYIRELLLTAAGGMNGRTAPLLLDPSQCARAINCAFRGGFPHTRPRWREITGLPKGKFQGGAVYRLSSGDRLVTCIGGKVSSTNLTTGVSTLIDTFPTKDFDVAYFCQADKYMIVQNGIFSPVENWPIIMHESTLINNLDIEVFNGTDLVKISTLPSPESKRVPIGKAMAFGHLRLFVAVERFWDSGVITGKPPGFNTDNGLVQFLAGNVMAPDNTQEILAFTETEYLNEGGAINLPTEMGTITSMGFYRNAATGSGLGALVVIAREGSAAYAVNTPRTEWKNTELGQPLFFGDGSDSPWALIQVNDDLMYRSRDGLRTINYSKAEIASASGSLSTVSLSESVSEFFDPDRYQESKLSRASLCRHDNRVLTLADSEELGDGSMSYRALVSLDNVVTANFGTAPGRAFDGAWTGPQHLFVFTARDGLRDQLFLIGRKVNKDTNFLFIADDSQVLDYDGSPTLCRIYTKEYSYNKWVEAKDFKYAELWFTKVEGDVTATLYWRPGGSSLWYPCSTSTLRVCDGSLPGYQPQLRVIAQSSDECDPSTKHRITTGFTLQYMVQWTGKAQLERAIFVADPLTDTLDFLKCDTEDCVQVAVGGVGVVPNDYAEYRI